MSSQEFRYALIEGATGEVWKRYINVNKMMDDIAFKDPSCFFIGDRFTMKGYTFAQSEEMYEKGELGE